MDSIDATQMLPAAQWADPQGQLLEDTWLLTIFAVLLATAVPWFVSRLNIDFAAASWALLALGAVYVALSVVSGFRGYAALTRQHALSALHAAGVIAMAVVWLRCGSLQNPLFLLAFVLPVLGASALSRWQPYVTAALAVLVVAAVALCQAPELRWYAPGRWLMRLLGSAPEATGAASPFPGFYAPIGYDIVLLEVFAILLFTCAVAAESLGNAFERLLDHLGATRMLAASGQQMWAALMRQLPLPALLIDAETLQIVFTSDVLEPFGIADPSLAGRNLLEVIRFSYPEAVQALITGNGGIVTAAPIRSADALRIADVRVQHLTHERRRLALVLLQDVTTSFCVAAALDVDEHAALVIDERGRVIAYNQAAHTLFPDIEAGSDASGMLQRLDATQTIAMKGAGWAGSTIDRRAGETPARTRWWEPGLTGRRRMRVMLEQRLYQATCTAVALPGERELLYVAALMPATTVSNTLSAPFAETALRVPR